jgi:hypothetical protein
MPIVSAASLIELLSPEEGYDRSAIYYRLQLRSLRCCRNRLDKGADGVVKLVLEYVTNDRSCFAELSEAAPVTKHKSRKRLEDALR